MDRLFKLTSITACLIMLLSGVGNTVYGQTAWYTVTRSGNTVGNWSDPASWTKDQNGEVDNDLNEVPVTGDLVYIINGNKILFDGGDLSYELLDIQIGSELIIEKSITGLQFTDVKGEGAVVVENETSIPTGNFQNADRGFIRKGGGTLVFNIPTAETLTLSGDYAFASFEKRGAGTLIANGVTLFDNLTISEGTVELSGNNPYKIEGDITIQKNTTVTDNGVAKNLEVYGDITNKGTVNLGDSHITFKGSKDQTLSASDIDGTLVGQFSLDYLALEKDKKGFAVTLKSKDKSSFVLTQKTSSLLDNLKKGTLKFDENIQLDINSYANGNKSINADVVLTLESSSSALYMKLGGALLLRGELHVNSGNLMLTKGLDLSGSGPASGITLYNQGKFFIDGGYAEMHQFRTSIGGTKHQGSFSMTGGELYIKNEKTSSYQPFALPYATNSFTLTGGDLRIESKNFTSTGDEDENNDGFKDKGILIGASEGNSTVSSNANLYINTKADQELQITSRASLPNVHINGEGAVSLRLVKFSELQSSDALSEEQPLKVLGELVINTNLYTHKNDVEIGRNLVINKEDAFYFNSSRKNDDRYKRNDNNIIFNGPQVSTIFINYAIDDDNADDDELLLYSLIIDKEGVYNPEDPNSSTAKVLINAHPSHVKAELGNDADQNESNILRITNNLEIKNGLLTQGEYSIRTYSETVKIGKTGQLGFYEYGVTPNSALIKFRPDNQTIEVEEGGRLGNIKINADRNRLTFIGDTHVQRAYYRHGTVYIGRYNFKLDIFETNIKSDYGFGSYKDDKDRQYHNMFLTDGKDSDKGLSIRIDEQTWYDQSKLDANGNVEIIYPIGFIDADDNIVYSPIRVDIKGNGASADLPSKEDGGYYTVRPVASTLHLVDNDYNSINFYWRLNREGFDDFSITNYPQIQYHGYLPSNLSDLSYFPGKVLNGDEEIANKIGGISPFERYAFSSPIIEEDYDEAYNLTSTYHKISFTEDWTGTTNTFVDLEDVNLTAGQKDAFIGAPKVYYWNPTVKATSNAADWFDENNWLIEKEGVQEPASTYPSINDVVIVDYRNSESIDLSLRFMDFVPLPLGEGETPVTTVAEVGKLIFADHNYRQPGAYLRNNIVFNVGTIDGPAIFNVYYNEISADNGVVNGDLGSWAINPNSMYNIHLQQGVDTDYDKSSAIDLSKTVIEIGALANLVEYPRTTIISANNSLRTAYINFKEFKSPELTMRNGSYLVIGNSSDNKLIDVDELNISEVNSTNKVGVIFTNAANKDVTLTVGDINIYNINHNNSNYGKGAEVFTYRKNNRNVVHNLNIKGSINFIKDETLLADQSYFNISPIFIADDKSLVVNTNFIGSENSSITTEGFSAGDYPISFGKVTINKDALSDTVLFDAEVKFLNTADQDVVNINKDFVLTTGTAVLSNPGIDLDLNSANTLAPLGTFYDFEIPTTAILRVEDGATVRMTGTKASMQLNGVLEVVGANVDFNVENGYNSIEYGTSGDAKIMIQNAYAEDGTLVAQTQFDLGGQLRVSSTLNDGKIRFKHTSGVVNIGGQTVISEYKNMGVLDLRGTSSSQFCLEFDYIPGENSFTLHGGNGITSYFINAEALGGSQFLYSDNARLSIATVKTVNAYISHLPYLDIQQGGLSLEASTQINKGVSIAEGTVLDQNDIAVTIYNGESIVNQGSWIKTDGSDFNVLYPTDDVGTLLYSTNDKTLQHQFHNLSILNGSMQFVGPFNASSSSVNIDGQLMINEDASLILDSDNKFGVDVHLKGLDQTISGKVLSDHGHYVVFDGGDAQYLTTLLGEFDNLRIDLTNGLHLQDISNSTLLYSLRINKNLDLVNGSFYIQEKTLLLSDYSTITAGVDGFGQDRMIVAGGKRRDGGIVREFSVGNNISNFVYPIGTDIDGEKKYSPVEFNFTSDFSSNPSADNYYIKVLPIDEYYAGLVGYEDDGDGNFVPIIDPNLLDYTWFLFSLNDKGEDTPLPDGFKASVVLHYHDNDLLQPSEGPEVIDTYSSVVFYEQSLAWQQELGLITKGNNTLTFNLNKATVLGPLNNGSLTGIYSMGDPNDMSLGIDKYYSKGTGSSWTGSDSWQKAVIEPKLGDDGKPEKIIIDGKEYFIYEETGRIDTNEYPSNGSIAYVDAKTEVMLGDASSLELSRVFLYGTLVVDNPGNAQGKFGEIYGNGTLHLKATEILPTGNWNEFFNATTGGEIVLELPNDNPNFIDGDTPGILLGNTIFKNGTELRKLTLMTDLVNATPKINYYLTNKNIILSDLEVGQSAILHVSDNVLAIENNVSVLNSAVFNVAETTEIITKGNFTLDDGAEVNLRGNLLLQGDLTIDETNTGSQLNSFSTSTVTFSGAKAEQVVRLKGGSLANVIIDKGDNSGIVDFTNEGRISGNLDFQSGKIRSSVSNSEEKDERLTVGTGLNAGNLTIENPENILNVTPNNYIIGRTHFVLNKDLKHQLVFPIGSSSAYNPIGVVTDALSHDVVWTADYIERNDNTLPTEELPMSEDDSGTEKGALLDGIGHEVKAVQKDGRWIVEPYLEPSEIIEAGVLVYIGKAQEQYPGLTDDYSFRTLLESASFSSERKNDYRFLGGTPTVIDNKDGKFIATTTPLGFKGQSRDSENNLTPALYYVPSKDPHHPDVVSSGRVKAISADNIQASNEGIRWSVSGTSDPDLPVELVSFSAEETADHLVRINWTTASEINNEYFLIERSRDGKSWSFVGEVEGYGNSNVLIDYELIDESPFNGASYYRLTQFDFDGVSEMFAPVIVNVKRDNLATYDVVVYPNPNYESTLYVELYGFEGQSSVMLYNQMGSTVISTLENENYFKYDISNLPSGIYFLKVVQGKNAVVKKVVVK